MAKKALITVVIPTYNRAKYLPRTIRSVQNQTFKNWELLIMDDGSTDQTRQVVKRFMSDPRIRYVRHKRNKGVCYSLNHALNLVRTKYFSQLDSDDWYSRDTLKRCVKKMEKAGAKAAVAYGHERVYKVDRKGRLMSRKLKRKPVFKGKYDFITYRHMFYPRFYLTKALKRVKGWSTKVPMGGRYAEDRQILLKLAGHYKFIRVNKVLYNRLQHKNNNSRRSNRLKYAKVTRYLYTNALKKWGGQYRPVFKWVSGRLKVGKLIRIKRRRRK